MKQATSQLYEGMYVLSAHLSDDARKKAFDKIRETVTSRGGEILKIHDQGRRRLAYEINRHREGYYFLIYFTLSPQYIDELWQEYQHNEDLIRFVTLKTDKVCDVIKFKQLAEQ